MLEADTSQQPVTPSAPDGVPGREEILTRVKACVAESLAIDADGIELASRLRGDLNADSLDFLDMLFAFEAEFGVPLHDRTTERLMRSDYQDEDLDADGSLPAKDLEELQEWLPALGEREEGTPVSPMQLFGYVTVESLVILVERELSEVGSKGT